VAAPVWRDDAAVGRLRPRDAAPWIERALAARVRGEADAPLRLGLATGDGHFLTMPGRLAGAAPVMGAKLVRTHAGGVDGAVLLLDPGTGAPRALVAARALTVLRTAALSLVAARLLGGAEAATAAVLGLGAQGRGHVRALLDLGGPRQIRLWDRSRERAASAAEEVAAEAAAAGVEVALVPSAVAAVDGVALVVTATASPAPLFPDGAAGAARLLIAVGAYRPEMSELPAQTVAGACRVVADDRQAVLAEAGEVVAAVARGDLTPEQVEDLAEVWAGRSATARGTGPVLFKSVGSALWDLAVADGVVRSGPA
jgi:ornithine cyclodeaminase/alanine dehydrogenase-like protein (mu-crystallin family)